MKIFATNSIKKLDAYTIENEPVSSIDLMERAAKALTHAIIGKWGKDTPVTVFAGPGNNGGDGLAIARLLSHAGYKVETYLFNPQNQLSPDCQLNKERLEKTDSVKFTEVTTQFVPPALTENHLVVDALFGSGLNKPLSGGFAAVVKYINSTSATVVAVDIPSGLMGEENAYNLPSNIVRADVTLTLQFPKLSFLFAENAAYVGKWEIIDIGLSREGIEQTETNYHLTEEQDIVQKIKPRGKFSHKGTFGHALLIAGSYGMAGASILSSRACLRSGVGLLTMHIPRQNNSIIQSAVPEAIIEHDASENTFSWATDTDSYQAMGIGPGLGTAEETEAAVIEQLKNSQLPCVIDADALNILANHKYMLKSLPQGSILTPHPKELERLVGKCQGSYERLMKACELAQTGKVHIILKGAYSAVITPEGKCWFNPTGNPGMATAGSGDVLTGIVLALLAQGYSPEDAARTGAYVHGLAGDMASIQKGITGMIAGDMIDHLPQAWIHLSGQ